jgi:hypothetical protein
MDTTRNRTSHFAQLNHGLYNLSVSGKHVYEQHLASVRQIDVMARLYLCHFAASGTGLPLTAAESALLLKFLKRRSLKHTDFS